MAIGKMIVKEIVWLKTLIRTKRKDVELAPTEEIKKAILKELIMHLLLRYGSKITATIFGLEIIKIIKKLKFG
jgi:hypothetical protein